MARLILFVVSFWTVVLLSEPALANCTTNTVYTPDGRVIMCQVCCYSGHCQTTCY